MDLPREGVLLRMVIEVVDAAERIDRLLPELERMLGSALVTLEKVQVIRYGEPAAPGGGDPSP